MDAKTISLTGIPAVRTLRGRASDLALRAFVGLSAGLAAARPARAEIIDEWADEMNTWMENFDVDIMPVVVTVALLASLASTAFNRIAGAVMFAFTVAGAFAYGARDNLVAIAGG